MYKATITRANGTHFDLYSSDHDGLLEATSVLVFNMRLFYTSINISKKISDKTYQLIGHYDADGKYVTEK